MKLVEANSPDRCEKVLGRMRDLIEESRALQKRHDKLVREYERLRLEIKRVIQP